MSSTEGKTKVRSRELGMAELGMAQPFFCFSLSVLHCPRVSRKELGEAEVEILWNS